MAAMCGFDKCQNDQKIEAWTGWQIQRFFIFTPNLGETIQFAYYFSNGLKPATRQKIEVWGPGGLLSRRIFSVPGRHQPISSGGRRGSFGLGSWTSWHPRGVDEKKQCIERHTWISTDFLRCFKHFCYRFCCLYEWFLCSWYWQYVCHFYFLCEQTIRMRATAMIFSRRHPILEIPGVFFKRNIWGQQKPWHFFRVLAWFSLGWMMEKYPRSMATFACNMDAWPRQVPRKGGRGSHSSFCWKGFLEVHK